MLLHALRRLTARVWRARRFPPSLVARCTAPADAELKAALEGTLRDGRLALAGADDTLQPALMRFYPAARDVSRIFAEARRGCSGTHADVLRCARNVLRVCARAQR
jgi:hypothetical protein